MQTEKKIIPVSNWEPTENSFAAVLYKTRLQRALSNEDTGKIDIGYFKKSGSEEGERNQQVQRECFTLEDIRAFLKMTKNIQFSA